MIIATALFVCFVVIIALNVISEILVADISIAISNEDIHKAINIFAVIFLPGTFLHELSHWLTANLLGVKTFGFSIRPKLYVGGIQMGAVIRHKVDPIRGSLIGAAPFIYGCTAVVLIGQWQLALHTLGQQLLDLNLNGFGRGMMALFTSPTNWLWLYLLFVISNTMFPSSSDRVEWGSGLFYLALIPLFLLWLGYDPTYVPAAVQTFLYTTATYLLVAFIITIFVNLLFITLIVGVVFMMAMIVG